MGDVPSLIETVCPVCLRKVGAVRTTAGDEVAIEGDCPEHGPWRTPIWRGPPSLAEWAPSARTGSLDCGCSPARGLPGGARSAGEPDDHQNGAAECPKGCGLCADHEQSTCTAVVEVTRRCNLRCPVCFAECSPDVQSADPGVDSLRALFRELFLTAGPVNVQLSGGEPTVRDDLPAVVAVAVQTGFTFVQLNTNGLRLAAEPGYAESLRAAGLDSVFLQFDGLAEHTWRSIRGRPLLDEKCRAIERCAGAGLAVVLVPTVVPGLNDGELGAILRFAAQRSPTVRGVHFQPVTRVGRYPADAGDRLTLPEVLRALEQQTRGGVRATDFQPNSCEHPWCSFRGRFWVRSDGRLEAFRASTEPVAVADSDARQVAPRAVAATSRQWGPLPARTVAEPQDELDRFLAEADRILTVSGMLFQDAWNVDLERLRRCCVHAVVPGAGRVPFCLWNLTSATGQRMYARC